MYGEHGLILETSTHLEDIVMSDYFQIEDRFVAQPGKDGSIRVEVEVEVSDGQLTYPTGVMRLPVNTEMLCSLVGSKSTSSEWCTKFHTRGMTVPVAKPVRGA